METVTPAFTETSFVSTESFTRKAFRYWTEQRPETDTNRYELMHGRIVMTPPAGWGHAEIEARIIQLLGNFVTEQNRGKVFGSSAGYDLPSGEILEPDASFIATDRWLEGPQVKRGQFLRIVPSLVVEILSPATAQRDRTEKKNLYELNGVEEYWIVNPDQRDVTVFQLVDGHYDTGRRFGPRQRLRSAILSGLEVAVRSLFL